VVDALQVLAGNVEPAAHVGAHADEDGVEVLPDFVEGDVFSDFRVEDDLTPISRMMSISAL
jgi:hypothetical protein